MNGSESLSLAAKKKTHRCERIRARCVHRVGGFSLFSFVCMCMDCYVFSAWNLYEFIFRWVGMLLTSGAARPAAIVSAFKLRMVLCIVYMGAEEMRSVIIIAMAIATQSVFPCPRSLPFGRIPSRSSRYREPLSHNQAHIKMASLQWNFTVFPDRHEPPLSLSYKIIIIC